MADRVSSVFLVKDGGSGKRACAILGVFLSLYEAQRFQKFLGRASYIDRLPIGVPIYEDVDYGPPEHGGDADNYWLQQEPDDDD